jgi:hypothetical protein
MAEPIDMLEVAKTLDPRFGENMPQEVADAFASGDITRVFRTSKEAFYTKMGAMGSAASPTGDYSGSIYAQHRDGRVARFKNPEVAQGHANPGQVARDAGWNAKTRGKAGESAFFDEAYVWSNDLNPKRNPDTSAAFNAVRQQNPTLTPDKAIAEVAKKNGPGFTPTTVADPRSIMGQYILETDSAVNSATHQR